MTETPSDPKGEGTSNAVVSPGNPTNHVQLPRYIRHEANGLYVFLRDFDSASHFTSFVDRVFRSGMRFVDLDYGSLSKLLYEWSPQDIFKFALEQENAGKAPVLRLATEIVSFPPLRQKYFRKIKLVESGEAASYYFEPVWEDPADQADGEGMVGKEKRVELKVDEFIAAMWCQNVRFGLDIDLITKALSDSGNQMLVIARMTIPTDGQDASVEETVNSLHRSNAPKLLPNGRVDLRQFQNRFPQVEKNTKLIKKVPRTLGKPGRTLEGKEIEPPIPQDFNIETLAGAGVRVERSTIGEFIVANMNGFLQIDSSSHSFSIVEKIINREGVGQRTTGNLVLRGDEYEEHGVVEERAQIDGMHMTFMADVFGHLVSRGGRVVLKESLVAGSVRSPGGVITVEGTASRATLEAVKGTITLQYAESCKIIGGKVSIEKAVHCDILAEELQVGSAEACALAASRMEIGSTGARHDTETTISILMPDISAMEQEQAELIRQKEELEATASAKNTEIETLSSQQEVRNYQILNERLRANELKMTMEQEANWQKLLGRVTPVLKTLRTLGGELRDIQALIDKLAGRIDIIGNATASVSKEVSCKIEEVTGETMIRTMIVPSDLALFDTIQARELPTFLRKAGADSTVLFNESEGEFELQWEDDSAE